MNDHHPLSLRPAVDDAFFARGDFEIRQDDLRAVIRVRPRGPRAPASALPPLPDDAPTELSIASLPARTDPWRLPEDFVPTVEVDGRSPLDPASTAAMSAPSRTASTASGPSPPWSPTSPGTSSAGAGASWT